MEENFLLLDGESLTVEKLMSVNINTKVDFTDEAWERVRKARKVIEDILEKGETVYGINTGFGNFSDVTISHEKLEILQENLIRSHASGVGPLLSIERVKRLCTLRLNVFAKGHSGISEESIKRIMKFYNNNCLSAIPEQGTVGASGDLAPLSHLALGFMGEGKLWNPKKNVYEDAQNVIEEFSLTPIKLHAKEGLALINGTQFITALGVEALYRACIVAQSADIICALTLEGLEGTPKAYMEKLHKARPHKGQILSAKTMRSILHNDKYTSEIYVGHIDCGKVQDAYCLRCAPQVHGVAYDTIAFVKNILETEMNSATDNPMVFADDGTIVSGGNFHGEFPAKACDYLAIAIHELSNISERRIERLLNGSLSGLPSFLVKEGGLNSGFMIAHCTAAALVSENKTLCHPGSVDSIPTSAGKEDHVSMGGWSARKCLQVVENVEKVLAIEYLASCQALYLRRPKKTTPPLEGIYELLRSNGVKPLDQDRIMYEDINTAHNLVKDGKLIEEIKKFEDLEDII